MAEVDAGAVAPAVPVATVPGTDQPVSAPTPPADGAQAQPEEGKEPVPAAKTFTEEETRRIVNERLTKERKRLRREVEAEVRARAAEQELERLRSERNQPQQPKGKPSAKDFENPEDYIDALTDWKIEQREARRQAESEKRARQHDESRYEEVRARTVHEKLIEPGRAKYEDFDDVVLSEDTPITDAMIEAASRLENGFDALHHIGLDRKEAQRIARLSSVEQVWAIRDLASKLAAPPKPTNAPAPIVPNSGNAAPKSGYRPEMSDKEYNEWRRRQIAQRR